MGRRIRRGSLSSDIVDEVDNRLRTVGTQAGKARRYKEYSRPPPGASHPGGVG